MGKKAVIINADDFGLSEGINKAVVIAHTNGILTSATLMVNMPGSDEAAEMSKSLPDLGVGVHLNLTEGCPAAKDPRVKCLSKPDGKFALSAAKLSVASAFSGKVRKAIRLELESQIQWVISKGIRPTHLDSHKHIHCFPTIFTIVSALADKYGISAIRWPLERQRFRDETWPKPDASGKVRAAIISTLARLNRLQNDKFFKTDEFFGIAHTGRIDVRFLRAVGLHNTVSIAEIMTHPGFPQGLERTQSRLIQQRESELKVLCDKQIRLLFEKSAIQLVHYGKL
jgi:hopanoid biosynthesis associated protein HpnK